jgi:hypothetical protein
MPRSEADLTSDPGEASLKLLQVFVFRGICSLNVLLTVYVGEQRLFVAFRTGPKKAFMQLLTARALWAGSANPLSISIRRYE